ncbi:hypothetical protein N505_0118535 [Rhodococcus aetherivorans]|nr:hypothetical protein N505_0118535 [Rhodococcus aetherivorans]
MTLHLVRAADLRAFGCVLTDTDGRVTAFLEKTQDPPTDQINASCYVFRREWIEKIPAGRPRLGGVGGVPVAARRRRPRVRPRRRRVLAGHGTPDEFVKGSADLLRGIAPSPTLDGERGEARVHPTSRVAPARCCSAEP